MSAMRGMLAEIEANLKLARQPFEGRLVPFLVDMWTAHKGEITRLPEDLQDNLHQAYIEIRMANVIVEADLHKVSHGAGYLDNRYTERCGKIAKAAGKAKTALAQWLANEAVYTQPKSVNKKEEAAHDKEGG